MTRIIVHAGFHKTATGSLQDFLHQNRENLKPYFDYYGKIDFSSAGLKTRRFGQRPFPWRRLQFRRAFRAFLAQIPDADTIVLSRETFSGVMPGHRDVFGRMVTNYAETAIPLAQVISSELISRFGPTADIRFLYTTRDQDTWLRSVYGHLLRSIHLRDSFETFCAKFEWPPNPEHDTQFIARALAPIPVYIARLEDFSDLPSGPADAILDLADVPDQVRQSLTLAKRSNQGQNHDIEQEFLNLNRSVQSKKTLRTVKDRIQKSGTLL